MIAGIKQFRKKLKLSQRQLAEKLNVSQSTVGMWECGRNKPRYDMLCTLSKLFNCKIDDLFSKDDTDVVGKEESLCFMEKMR